MSQIRRNFVFQFTYYHNIQIQISSLDHGVIVYMFLDMDGILFVILIHEMMYERDENDVRISTTI